MQRARVEKVTSLMRAASMRVVFASASVRDPKERERARMVARWDEEVEYLPHVLWVEWQELVDAFRRIEAGEDLSDEEASMLEARIDRFQKLADA